MLFLVFGGKVLFGLLIFVKFWIGVGIRFFGVFVWSSVFFDDGFVW